MLMTAAGTPAKMEVLVSIQLKVINAFVLLDIQAFNVKKVSIIYRNLISCIKNKNLFYLSTSFNILSSTFYMSVFKF